MGPGLNTQVSKARPGAPLFPACDGKAERTSPAHRLTCYGAPLGSGAGCDRGWQRRSALLETGPTEHRTTLRGLERNGRFGGAFRTHSPGFRTYAVAGSGHALDLALFTPLGIVLELFVVKEELLAGGKNEVVTAIRALQNLVDKIHYASPRTCLGIFQYCVE
jgi:hypothetical protein